MCVIGSELSFSICSCRLARPLIPVDGRGRLPPPPPPTHRGSPPERKHLPGGDNLNDGGLQSDPRSSVAPAPTAAKVFFPCGTRLFVKLALHWDLVASWPYVSA